MADDPNKPQEPIAAAVAEAPKGGFLQSIIDIFVDPFKVFARIDAGLTWWKPYLFVSVVMMITSYFMLPLQRKVMELKMQNLSEEQLQKAAEQFGKWAPVGLVVVPLGIIVIYLIMAGIAHLCVNIMSTRSSFKKTLSLLSFCGIISIIEQIIGTVILRMRGPESIESAADMKFSLSLAPLVGDGKGLLGAVLQSLSIFQIWYYIVLILGIAAVFKISRKAAIIPVLPIWIISVIMIWIGGSFSARTG
jgi:hypothetical protein